MSDQKRFALAVILIVGILGVHSLLTPRPPKSGQPPEALPDISEPAALAKPAASQQARLPEAAAQVEGPEDSLIIIETPFIRAELSTATAGIKRLWTKSNGNKLFEEQPLLAPADGFPKTLELFIGEAQGSAPRFVLRQAHDNEAVFVSAHDKETEITKRFIFSNTNYNIDLYISIANKSRAEKIISYDLRAASGLQFTSALDKRFLNVGSSLDNQQVVWIRPKDAVSAAKKETVHEVARNPRWAVMRNAHSSTIITPGQETSYIYLTWGQGSSTNEENWLLGLVTPPALVAAGAEITHRYSLYAGPTLEEFLRPLGLAAAVNYGKLDFICKALVMVLAFFYSLTGSYGFSIICLTLAINLFIYPLTYKNVKSMRHMQAVQPQLSKLREMHKGNQQKLQAEMMKLYREHKVNPLGGCLPMLVQMPIFIALYITLARSPMLKGTNFLWIKDLSLPDALFDFGRTLPLLGESFNLLPFLMMAAMAAQQKISMQARSGGAQRSPQEEQQQKMMMLMPVIFAFFFYNLPSGLVLYWTVNTALMALAHYLIQRQLETTAGGSV